MTAVVCGVDGSDASLQAATIGAGLARALGADAVAVQAYEDAPVFPYGDLEERERMRNAARTRAASRLGELELGERLGCETLVRPGEPADVLRELAEERAARLIAVGSRGRGQLSGAVLGSISASLIRAGERPVLVVPPSAVDHPPLAGSAIACGVDGSLESRAAAQMAAEISQRLGARLVIVHARAHLPVGAGAIGPAPAVEDLDLEQHAREAVDRVVQDVAGDDAVVRHVEAGGSAAKALADAAVMADASLLVVGDSGHGSVAAAVFGSAARQLAGSAPLPVLVVPPPDEPV
jgi:nucleotide-binding universal stress UspA family protein